MRNEDKVLLLCEIMGIDTTPYVIKYIEELRCSDIYLRLCKNVIEARKLTSYKAQRLVDEFELIDFSKVDTLQKFFVLKAKINYLVTNSEYSSFLNPFFYEPESSVVEVGNISIEFDKKQYTLNDVILDERYTQRYKIEYFKNSYLEWRKEVEDYVIDPLKDLVINKEKLPSLVLFEPEMKWLIVLMIFANAIFLIGPLIPSEFIRSLYQSTCPSMFLQYTFYFSFFTMILINLVLIITVNYRIRRNRHYTTAMKLIEKPSKKIDEINDLCQQLYSYILKGVNDNKLLTKEIKKFSIQKSDLAALIFLLRIRDEKEDVEEKDIPILLRILLLIFGVLCCILIVTLLIRVGGR